MHYMESKAYQSRVNKAYEEWKILEPAVAIKYSPGDRLQARIEKLDV